MNKFHEALNRPGSTPLWVAFWLYGVLASQVLFGTIMLAFNQVDTLLFGALLLVFVAYTAWVLNTVWRNADNVREPKHGQIARFLTVAWSINAVLVSGFLFLSHLNALTSPFPALF